MIAGAGNAAIVIAGYLSGTRENTVTRAWPIATTTTRKIMKTTLNDALEDSIVNDAAPVRFTWPLSDKELFRELHEFWDGDYGYDISGDDIEIHGWDDDGVSAFRVIANVSRHL